MAWIPIKRDAIIEAVRRRYTVPTIRPGPSLVGIGREP